jgi:hypothetical protein
MSASKAREGGDRVSKARLIYLVVLACFFASFFGGFVFRLAGMSDGE